MVCVYMVTSANEYLDGGYMLYVCLSACFSTISDKLGRIWFRNLG